jgi:hypothetical protein
MSYKRTAVVAKKPAAPKGGSITFTGVDLNEVLDFIGATVESGNKIHLNLKGTSFRISDGEKTYSMMLKDREEEGLYGSLKAETASATSEFPSFARWDSQAK